MAIHQIELERMETLLKQRVNKHLIYCQTHIDDDRGLPMIRDERSRSESRFELVGEGFELIVALYNHAEELIRLARREQDS